MNKALTVKHHTTVNRAGIFMIGITLLSAFCIYPAFTADKTELTCGIHETGEFRLRVYFFFKSLNFFIIDKTKSIEDYEIIIGLSTDWISFGPMYTYGLFRELYNPLGYTTGSDVFSEESVLRLKGSFEPGPKRFLCLSPFPDILMLFLQTGDEVPLFCGGQLSVPVGEIGKTELIYSFSDPLEKTIDDTWFTDSHQFSGGTISHLSMKNLIHTGNFLWSLSGSISGGPMIMPGYFVHSYISGELQRCALSFFFGNCSEHYITPDGSYKEKLIKTGTAISFSPFSRFTLDLCYSFDIDHPSPFPQDYLYTTHNISGKATLKQMTWKEVLINIIISGESTLSCDQQKKEKRKHEIAVCTGISGKNLTGETFLSFSQNKEKEIALKWKTTFSLLFGLHSFTIQSIFYKEKLFPGKSFPGNDFSWKGKLDYNSGTLKTEKGRLTIRASLSCKKQIPFTETGYWLLKENPFDFIIFSFGCQVAGE